MDSNQKGTLSMSVTEGKSDSWRKVKWSFLAYSGLENGVGWLEQTQGSYTSESTLWRLFYKKEKSLIDSIEILEGAGHHRLRADEYPFWFKELKRAAD